MNRREFLTKSSLALAAASIPDTISAKECQSYHVFANSRPHPHDLDFASALQAAEAIRKKQISSVELTQRAFARIDKFNPQLNAFVYQTRDEALTQAKKADEAQSHGNPSRRHSTASPSTSKKVSA